MPEPPKTARKRSATIASTAAPTTSKRRKLVKQPVVEAELGNSLSPLKPTRDAPISESLDPEQELAVENISKISAENAAPTKAKRGRPPKSKTTSSIAKRGRPAKSVVDHFVADREPEQVETINELKPLVEGDLQKQHAIVKVPKNCRARSKPMGKSSTVLISTNAPKHTANEDTAPVPPDAGNDVEISRENATSVRGAAGRRRGRAPVYAESEDEEEVVKPRSKRAKVDKHVAPIDEPVQRKRGRPAAEQASVDHDVVLDEETVGRKTGVQIETELSTLSVVQQAVKRRGRLSKKAEVLTLLAPEDPTAVKAPSRGRKATRKPHASKLEPQTVDEEQAVVASRGRTNVDAPEESEDARDLRAETAEIVQPKRRGRPRKTTPTAAPSETVYEELVVTASKVSADAGVLVIAKKTSRNRVPRKLQDNSNPVRLGKFPVDEMAQTAGADAAGSDVAEDTADQHVEVPKKRRGRPPKAAKDRVVAEDSAKSDVSKPRKRAQKDVVKDVIHEDAEVEVVSQMTKTITKSRSKKQVKPDDDESHDVAEATHKTSRAKIVMAEAIQPGNDITPNKTVTKLNTKVASKSPMVNESGRNINPQKPMPLTAQSVNIRSPQKARSTKPVLPMFKMGSRRRGGGGGEWQKEDWFEPSVPASLLR